MPIYEFQCVQCGETRSFLQGLSDATPPCPTCPEAEQKKLMSLQSPPQFKGHGFYSTDYAERRTGKKKDQC